MRRFCWNAVTAVLSVLATFTLSTQALGSPSSPLDKEAPPNRASEVSPAPAQGAGSKSTKVAGKTKDSPSKSEPPKVKDSPTAAAEETPVFPGLEMVDPAELVMAATKRVTTVAQAPFIVHVLTAKEMKEQGHSILFDAVGRMPGYLPFNQGQHWNPEVLPLGIFGGHLVLWNGVTLRDTVTVLHLFSRQMPIEMIKRVEATTGPGGVLWGSNSFVGIVALTTKTADDVDGVEAYVGLGTGPGRPENYKLYVMGGQKFWNNKIQALVHVSYQTWREAYRTGRSNLMMANMPLPNGPAVFGPVIDIRPARSHLLQTNGVISAGPISVGWKIPVYARMIQATALNNGIFNEGLGEDALGCTSPAADCIDPDGLGRGIRWDAFERMAYISYSDRFWNDRINVGVKAYYLEIDRDIDPMMFIPPSELIPGGINYSQNNTGYAPGATVDIGVSITNNHRLLVGGDVSYTYVPKRYLLWRHYDATTARLPILCVETPTADNKCPVPVNFEFNRVIGGAYISDQLSLFDRLTLEGGFRFEMASGEYGYGFSPIFSGGAVVRLFDEVYIKANYADGFRPTTQYQTASHPQNIVYASSADLRPERSRAILGQLVATVLRDKKPFKNIAITSSYSYTWIEDFTHVFGSVWVNLEPFGIDHAQFTAKMLLNGGHYLSLGYNFLNISDAGRGLLRSVPSQWFNTAVYFRLIGDRLALSSNLLVIGSAEDPNKYPTTEGASIYQGRVEELNGVPTAVKDPTYIASGTDIVYDRLNPAAIWNIGLQSAWMSRKLIVRADAYNVLDSSYYYPEPEFDVTARLFHQPNPAERFSFLVSVSYQH